MGQAKSEPAPGDQSGQGGTGQPGDPPLPENSVRVYRYQSQSKSYLPAPGPSGVVTSQPKLMARTQPMDPKGGMDPKTEDRPLSQIPVAVLPTIPIPGCPPGLEYLLQVDTLFVRQKNDGWEELEIANKYLVLDCANRIVFYASEESDYSERHYWGNGRAFEMPIVDWSNQEVLRFKRYRAPWYCCNCDEAIQQLLEVFDLTGNIIGSVETSDDRLAFMIKNELGEDALLISWPKPPADGDAHKDCCCCSCGPGSGRMRGFGFDIFSVNGEQKLGTITKVWAGLVQEVFSDADNYVIQFPMDLDVKMKATLLGACILLDYRFFERTNNHHNIP